MMQEEYKLMIDTNRVFLECLLDQVEKEQGEIRKQIKGQVIMILTLTTNQKLSKMATS